MKAEPRTRASPAKPAKPARKAGAARTAPAARPAPPRESERKRGISDAAVANARRKAERVNPYVLPPVAPGVIPDGATLAQDDAISGLYGFAGGGSAYGAGYGLGSGFPAFPGFAYLAELSQRPEYRHISETIAREMTRKWIRLSAVGTDDKTAKVALLKTALEKFGLQDLFRRVAEHDGFFGRAHLYVDTGNTDDPDELKTPLVASTAKIAKAGLKAFRIVEPIWTYPNGYNATDPLRPDFYKPTSWFVMGKTIHATRLLTFVSRELPDILKPAYSFAGVSLSQMALSYVDNWLRTQQSVSDLVHSFSVNGLMTDLSADMTGGDGSGSEKRATLFNLTRDNSGVMLLNKASADDPGEEFFNISTPLGTLDKLQAQAQEQMASVSSIPLVKLLGITPSGLNASSEGEIRVFYDFIAALQAHLFDKHLLRAIQLVQLSEWGEVDPDIIYTWETLWQLDEAGRASVRKTEMDTDIAAIGAGVLSPIESRTRIAAEEGSPYSGLDVDDAPAPPEEAESPDDSKGNPSPRQEEPGASRFATAGDAA